MKKYLAIFLLTSSVALAIIGIVKPTPPSYILSDDFEETNTGGGLGTGTDGFDDAQINTLGGTVDQDYTGVVLAGAQSLRFTTAGAIARYILTSTRTNIDFYFQYRPVTLPASGSAILFEATQAGGAGSSPVTVYLYSTGQLKIFNGSSGGSQTVSTMSAGTTYCVWGHWENGGTASVAFAVKTGSEIRPTSGNNYDSVSGGNGTQAIERPVLESPSTEGIHDRFRITAGALIPSIP